MSEPISRHFHREKVGELGQDTGLLVLIMTPGIKPTIDDVTARLGFLDHFIRFRAVWILPIDVTIGDAPLKLYNGESISHQRGTDQAFRFVGILCEHITTSYRAGELRRIQLASL